MEEKLEEMKLLGWSGDGRGRERDQIRNGGGAGRG
jgi:hypothetical protein